MDSDRILREGLWQQVARLLREDISGGRLTPGERLLEIDLADRFGVSRGPIREAFRELARSGLVVSRPHQGVVVSRPSDAELEEIFVFREVLETAAARIAQAKVLPEDIDRLGGILDAMEAAGASNESAARKALDLRFHREVFVIADSARLLAAHDDLTTQLLLSATLNEAMNDDVYPPAALHRGILKALATDDEERLVAAVKAHYLWAGDRLFGSNGAHSGKRTRKARARGGRKPAAPAG